MHFLTMLLADQMSSAFGQHIGAIAVEIIYPKFVHNRILLRKLLRTRHSVIVNCSVYYGVWCVGELEQDVTKLCEGWQLNLMGWALMQVRAYFQAVSEFESFMVVP